MTKTSPITVELGHVRLVPEMLGPVSRNGMFIVGPTLVHRSCGFSMAPDKRIVLCISYWLTNLGFAETSSPVTCLACLVSVLP